MGCQNARIILYGGVEEDVELFQETAESSITGCGTATCYKCAGNAALRSCKSLTFMPLDNRT